MSSSIAWLGLGHMGTPMAQRIVDHGHQLTVWNRSPQRTKPFADAGAQVARSPAVAAEDADLVITMLSDADALEGVLFGDNGVLAGLRPGSVLVQMSTISPQEIRDIARRLPAGVDLVDAPVAGSTPAANAGSLMIFTGGKAAILDRVEPVLAALGNVRRCGDVGTGSALKLVVNTGLLVSVAAIGDALALADNLGVSREIALEAMKGGALAGVIGRVTGAAQFSISLAAKDLRLATAAAGGRLPVTEGAASRVADAITAGLADQDIAALA